MLHAIIIDDEHNGIRSLELLITRFVKDVKVVAMTSDPYEGIELINNYRPDIVFLDINMPALSGFEVLEELEYNTFSLIFTTAHQEFAIQAIKRTATDYLLKPIDSDELILAVQRVKERISEKRNSPDMQKLLREIVGFNNMKVSLPSKTSIEYVLPSKIIYIEANYNTCKVFLTNMTMIEVKRLLKDYEWMLCRESLYFMRIHNSFIVNLNYITRYSKENGGYAVVQGKKKIPIAKGKKEDFLKWLNISKDTEQIENGL